jgi:dUTP pyrophosphatase
MERSTEVEVQIVRDDPGVPLPRYAHPGDAGMDVYAAADLELAPLQRALVPTGLRVALPQGYELQVRPRSGLARHHGLTIVNAPGTIDEGYRGPLGILMINLGDQPVRIERGHAIAQLVLAPVHRARLKLVDELPSSVRGEGGFGSTGR